MIMNKKVILGTLLASSFLLSTQSAEAKTSSLKSESKVVVTVKKTNSVYKDSNLKKSKKVKANTVYKVNGYRIINKKHYYRVYQEDSKGKLVYKGYLLNKNTKEVTKHNEKKQLVTMIKKDSSWNNLYLTKKLASYDGKKKAINFETKTYYKVNNKKYYSLYRGKKWLGYMDGSSLKKMIAKNASEDSIYQIKKEYTIYKDMFFTKKGKGIVNKKVIVRNIYEAGNKVQYASISDLNGKWLGYINFSALKRISLSDSVEDTKPKPEKPKPDEDVTDSNNIDRSEAIKQLKTLLNDLDQMYQIPKEDFDKSETFATISKAGEKAKDMIQNPSRYTVKEIVKQKKILIEEAEQIRLDTNLLTHLGKDYKETLTDFEKNYYLSNSEKRVIKSVNNELSQSYSKATSTKTLRYYDSYKKAKVILTKIPNDIRENIDSENCIPLSTIDELKQWSLELNRRDIKPYELERAKVFFKDLFTDCTVETFIEDIELLNKIIAAADAKDTGISGNDPTFISVADIGKVMELKKDMGNLQVNDGLFYNLNNDIYYYMGSVIDKASEDDAYYKNVEDVLPHIHKLLDHVDKLRDETNYASIYLVKSLSNDEENPKYIWHPELLSIIKKQNQIKEEFFDCLKKLLHNEEKVPDAPRDTLDELWGRDILQLEIAYLG